MQRRKLTADSSTDDADSFQTSSVRPEANALVLLFVTNASAGLIGGTPTVPTISGNGLVWVRIQTVSFGTQNDRRLTAFRALGSTPAEGGLTIDFGGQTQDYCAWSLFEYSGADAGDGGASAVVGSVTATGNGTTLTAALSQSADPAHNVAVGGIALELAADPTRPVTPGAGFTEIDELNPEQFLGRGTSLQTQDASPAVSGVSWTWPAAENAAAIALEVKAKADKGSPGPPHELTPDEQLIKRFEPVLFFHPDEKFFPVDAKSFVEHCALWTSTAPFDDKSTWGGAPGTAFPRKPQVEAGHLSAVPGPGLTYKFDEILGKGKDNRFLEIGAWKDKTETAEPAVTEDSENVYANRDKIDDLFKNEFEASRFRYQAEVFTASRLKNIIGSDVNLTKTLALRANPKLLCYYLLFPAHVQSVGADTCSAVEAQEVACHAGDWHCIAILLEGEGDDPAGYTPKFLGLTGSRPKAVDVGGGQLEYRPHQFDEENRTVIKVEQWKSGQPATTDGHPRVHVSLGSHSLYIQGGEVEVDPFSANEAPRNCGIMDGPGPVSPPPADDDDASDRDTEELAAIIAKFIGGLVTGFFVQGWAAAEIEALAIYNRPFGVGDTPASDDAPNSDQIPSAGDGKTLLPAGLRVPDAGNDVESWRAQGDTSIGSVVDRPTQRWWPDDDNERGFWGRWGQQVTSDPLGRRSGPRFPNYAVMFIQALADGDTRNLF
ncbi:hypothetical protein ACQI5H_06145 [Mycobacterium heidelbergense]|uniref:hypothetical protein n=1 Tax=Mycobacterium heidelbergense TaxID=53376 RepID=UPI003CFB98F1